MNQRGNEEWPGATTAALLVILVLSLTLSALSMFSIINMITTSDIGFSVYNTDPFHHMKSNTERLIFCTKYLSKTFIIFSLNS